MSEIKHFILKLYNHDNELIWAYLMHGRTKAQALSIFAQILATDVDIAYDFSKTERIEVIETALKN